MACTKQLYRTQREAEAARHTLKKTLRKRGGGHGLRKLNSYLCDECQAWHIGRSSRYQVKLETVKIPTDTQIKKRLRKIEDRMDRDLRQRAFLLGKIIE